MPQLNLILPQKSHWVIPKTNSGIHLPTRTTWPVNNKQLLNKCSEESSVFARDKDEVDLIKNLQMEIVLTDNAPVAKTYHAIPRPLYEAVKAHIQDIC